MESHFGRAPGHMMEHLFDDIFKFIIFYFLYGLHKYYFNFFKWTSHVTSASTSIKLQIQIYVRIKT